MKSNKPWQFLHMVIYVSNVCNAHTIFGLIGHRFGGFVYVGNGYINVVVCN